MIRRPPRFTRTDTLFPYPTLFRSDEGIVLGRAPAGDNRFPNRLRKSREEALVGCHRIELAAGARLAVGEIVGRAGRQTLDEGLSVFGQLPGLVAGGGCSDERRVGTEFVSTCSTPGSSTPKQNT